MGISPAALNLLALARSSGADFSRVVTLGRQRMEMPAEEVEDFFRKRNRPDLAQRVGAEWGDGYCEPLLKSAFGSSIVHSVDASDYERATIIHDFNTPIRPAERYSVVLDFGTLEHVFNVPMAFDNAARLTAIGGHILHVLPGNNRAGHGFYQFSPEFFHQVYAPERGFEGTRVFAAGGGSPDVWYEIGAPRTLKRRVNLTSREQLNMLVITRMTGESAPLIERPVQQSDYVELWQAERSGKAERGRRNPIERSLRAAFNSLRHGRKVAKQDFSASRSDLTRLRVADLTATF